MSPTHVSLVTDIIVKNLSYLLKNSSPESIYIKSYFINLYFKCSAENVPVILGNSAKAHQIGPECPPLNHCNTLHSNRAVCDFINENHPT